MDSSVIENYPVRPAKKALPKWFKDLPREKFLLQLGNEIPTIKQCMPATDMLTSGYIIDNPADIDLKQENAPGNYIENRVKVSDEKYYPEAHQFEMCPVKTPSKQQWIKLKNPWMVRTPPGYSCLFIQPFYDFNPNIRLFPGIVDTDSFDTPVEFPGWVVKEHVYRAGQPLMQVIPFKRDEWKMTMEHVETFEPAMTEELRYKDIHHAKKKFS
jgi:hypothetical protein